MECINLRAWRSVNQTSVARTALLPLFHSPSFDNHPQYSILFCLSCSSYVFPFQFQEELDLDEIAGVLQTGHSALTQQLPEVSCEAVPNVDWHQKDVFKRVKQEDESIPAIIVKDLRDFFPSNYAELSLKHFTISTFDSATIFCRGVWPSPGEGLRISLVQATFIPGGMILSWSILYLARRWHIILCLEKEPGQRPVVVHNVPDPFEFLDEIWEGREQVMK